MENFIERLKVSRVGGDNPFKSVFDLFLNLEANIHQYFGYQEDWVTIPLADYTDYHWQIIGGDRGKVGFGDTPDTVIKGINGDYEPGYYEDPIYTQRFLPKWVYRGEDYTMISIDTQTDGNKFLAIFTNSKEVLVTTPKEEKTCTK